MARVLCLVERAARLGVEKQPDPRPETHGDLLVEKSGDAAESPRGRVSQAVSEHSQFQSHPGLRPHSASLYPTNRFNRGNSAPVVSAVWNQRGADSRGDYVRLVEN